MKNIKKLISIAFVALLTIVVFTSCEEVENQRFPQLTNGGFVKFVEQPDVWEGLEIIGGISLVRYHIGADPATASFIAMTEDPNGNIASYELFVLADFEDAPDEPIAYMSTTSFPFNVSFTTADMAALFGVPVETFEQNDTFEFSSRTTLIDGTVYNSDPSDCDCPQEAGDPGGTGIWNEGNIDAILLQGGDTGDNFLLPAIRWIVKYRDPT